MNKCKFESCGNLTNNPQYCSRSCAAKANNRTAPKRKMENACRACQAPIPTRKTWCSDCLENSRPLPRNRTWKPTLEESAENPSRRSYNDRCTIILSQCSVCDKPLNNHGPNGNNKGRYKNCPDHRGAVVGQNMRKVERINNWLSGSWNGAQTKNPGKLSKTIRDYLIEEANNYCQSSTCPMDGKQIPTHPTDGASILEIDHIDGNGENHSPSNLIALCPTCHALTPTYRGRNQGSGRKVYYHRRSYPESN